MYLNRELSWIEFNRRVLAEGLDKNLPPLERFRFLSIVSANFDEFFMIRMAGLKRALKTGKTDDPSGYGAAEQLAAASEKIRPMFTELHKCLAEEVFPAMKAGGLEFIRPPFEGRDGDYLASYFAREILPVLTPLRFGTADKNGDEAPPVIANGVTYGSFLLAKDGEKFVSIVDIPPVLDRVVFVPQDSSEVRWALLDDLLMLWGDMLFSGYAVQERMLFRVQRDADFSVDEQRDEDFIEAMTEVIADREHSPAVRMAYSSGSPELQKEIGRSLDLSPEDLYMIDGPFNLGTLRSLVRIQGFDGLKLPQKKQYPHPAFPDDQSVWDCMKHGDILLALPYHNFDPVIRFFNEAAADPQVISIKTALYRTSGDSPIIRALEQAALNGKHVTAVVELKARFDEERNISWAVRLEKAGVIVIYGLAHLKVHAKISQVIRRESGSLVRYIHLATGNYNDKTARQYSDLSLFTINEDFGHDATVLFNALSGYSLAGAMKKLVAAPWFLKQRLTELIRRETARAKQGAPGKITAKMNALVDPGIIDALYEASRAGVQIQLNIRGICALVPGVEGLSENIRVISLVDYYLEHSRIYYFYNGGAEELYLSSADWMPRNLERRVELLIPVLDPSVQEEVREILGCYFKTSPRVWTLAPDGSWKQGLEDKHAYPNVRWRKPFNAQEYLLDMMRKKSERHWKIKQELVIRRRSLAEVK